MPDPDAPPSLRKRVFTTEISLGNILIIASLLGPIILFYANTTSTISNHEYRLSAVERALEAGRTERLAFQAEMRLLATGIREDVIVMKGTVRRLEEQKNGTPVR